MWNIKFKYVYLKLMLPYEEIDDCRQIKLNPIFFAMYFNIWARRQVVRVHFGLCTSAMRRGYVAWIMSYACAARNRTGFAFRTARRARRAMHRGCIVQAGRSEFNGIWYSALEFLNPLAYLQFLRMRQRGRCPWLYHYRPRHFLGRR